MGGRKHVGSSRASNFVLIGKFIEWVAGSREAFRESTTGGVPQAGAAGRRL